MSDRSMQRAHSFKNTVDAGSGRLRRGEVRLQIRKKDKHDRIKSKRSSRPTICYNVNDVSTMVKEVMAKESCKEALSLDEVKVAALGVRHVLNYTLDNMPDQMPKVLQVLDTRLLFDFILTCLKSSPCAGGSYEMAVALSTIQRDMACAASTIACSPGIAGLEENLELLHPLLDVTTQDIFDLETCMHSFYAMGNFAQEGPAFCDHLLQRGRQLAASFGNSAAIVLEKQSWPVGAEEMTEYLQSVLHCMTSTIHHEVIKREFLKGFFILSNAVWKAHKQNTLHLAVTDLTFKYMLAIDLAVLGACEDYERDSVDVTRIFQRSLSFINDRGFSTDLRTEAMRVLAELAKRGGPLWIDRILAADFLTIAAIHLKSESPGLIQRFCLYALQGVAAGSPRQVDALAKLRPLVQAIFDRAIDSIWKIRIPAAETACRLFQNSSDPVVLSKIHGFEVLDKILTEIEPRERSLRKVALDALRRTLQAYRDVNNEAPYKRDPAIGRIESHLQTQATTCESSAGIWEAFFRDAGEEENMAPEKDMVAIALPEKVLFPTNVRGDINAPLGTWGGSFHN